MRWCAESAALAWLLVVLAMGAQALGWWQGGAPLDTSILAMLPRDAGTAWEQRARDGVVARGERQLLVLVGNADPRAAARAAQAAEAQLLAAPLACGATTGLQASADFLAHHRDALIDEAARAELRTATPERLAQQALARLYSPLTGAGGLGAGEDPFGLHARWLQAQYGHSGLQAGAGRLLAEAEGLSWVALSCETAASPFERELQQRVGTALAAAREAAGAVPGTELLAAGVVLHAEAAAATAQSEIALIGSVGFVGIAVMVLAVFGAIRLVFVLQLPILVGALAGLSVCLLVFGRVHALTLVFGASLLGVAVDYPIHYASHVRTGDTLAARLATLRALFPGLTIAMLTTVAAYLALAIPPFPGLRQMALFAGCGLAAAWLCVVCWGPWLVTHGVRRQAPAVRALVGLQRRIARWPLRARGAGLVLLCLAALPGVLQVRVDDDLRMLQNSPPALLAEQAHVARVAGLASPAQYLLVTGPDAATVLQREEALAPALDRAIGAGRLQGYLALSQWTPSPARQASDRQLLGERIYAPGAALEQLARAAGFDAAWVEAERARFEAAGATPLTLDAWLERPAAAGLRAQWLGCRADGCASVVLLQGIAGAAGLQALAALSDPNGGVLWIDTVARTSALLAQYRIGMVEVLGLAVLASGVLLWLRHRNAALLALAPPLVAAFLTLALFGWAGIALNLFVVLAFVLVLGMGVDYGIYLTEPIDQDLSGVGVALDVLTTILGFGLLALSSTPALHLFGLALVVAVSLSWLVACLTGLRASAPAVVADTVLTDGGGR